MLVEQWASQLAKGEAITRTTASGQSVNLSLVTQNDLDDLVEMLQDERVTEYLFFAPAADEVYIGYFQPIIDEIKQALELQQLAKNLILVARDDNGRYMGMSGLTQVMFLEGNYEVGFQLPAHAWGQGLATLLSDTLLSIAFEHFSAHKVTADCYGGNVGSYKTLQKVGLVAEGKQSDYYKLASGFDDKLHFGITATQWKARGA